VPPEIEDVRIEPSPSGTAVVVFTGEHDLASQVEVRDLLDGLVSSHDLVVADFSDACFVDSSIIGVLMEMNKEATSQGRVFRLQLATADIVHRAFDLRHVSEVIEIFSTRDDALGLS
jgi:anti-anti-sigma factor